MARFRVKKVSKEKRRVQKLVLDLRNDMSDSERKYYVDDNFDFSKYLFDFAEKNSSISYGFDQESEWE